MAGTCVFDPLDSYKGYIIYRTTDDDGIVRYVAYRPSDYVPCSSAKDLETLHWLLDGRKE